MKITGRAQYITETNQEAFMKGGEFLGAGEFTVKVKDIEANDAEGRYFTIVFENNEGKQYKHNQFVPPFDQDYQEKQYIELLSRLGIKLNLPDLTFDTEQLINKFCNIVVKWKFRDNLGRYMPQLSYIKVWNKGDEVVNKPTPKTDEQRAEETQNNSNNQQQTPMSQQSNPFAGNDPLGYDDQDLAF